MEPMKMTDAPDGMLEQLMLDDDWVFEQKMDGARVIVEASQMNGVLDVTWHGAATFAAAKQHFGKLEGELLEMMKHEDISRVTFDGELMIRDGEYRVFDLLFLEYGDGDIAVNELNHYVDRRIPLEEIFLYDGSPSLQLVRQMEGYEAKLALWVGVNAAGAEGVMAKHLRKPYEFGKRVKHQLKFKLVKTADLVVLETRRTFKPDDVTVHTGSAKLGYFVPAADRPEGVAEETPYRYICSASLIGKDLSIEPGDIVEVAYLYRDDRGGLVQPRILHKRLDKEPTECTVDQFPAYSRDTVEVAS